MSITAKVIDCSDKCAKILYQNELVSADDEFAALTLLPDTWRRIDNRLGLTNMQARYQTTNQPIDYIGLAAHNLFTVGAPLVDISYANSVGGALTFVDQIELTSDDAVLHKLPSTINAPEIEIKVLNAPSESELGVTYAGQVLTMDQPIYGGHSPQSLSASTRYQSTMSDTGQFLGRTITRQGTETTFDWRHLDPEWYREHFQPFVESAKTRPFFIQWRPDLYSATEYAHTTRDIKPSNMGGGHRLMSVSMTVRGHADT